MENNKKIKWIVCFLVLGTIFLFFQAFGYKKILRETNQIIFCSRIFLTQEQKQWLSPYQHVGETIQFKSNKNNFNTLTVTKIENYLGNDSCNWVEIGSNQEEGTDIQLIKSPCEDNSNGDCKVEINVSSTGDELPFIFKFYDKFFNTTETKNGNKNDSYIPYLNVFRLENSYISEEEQGSVYIIDEKNRITDDPYNANPYIWDKIIKQFYWDKNKGLIKYITSDGEIFEKIDG